MRRYFGLRLGLSLAALIGIFALSNFGPASAGYRHVGIGAVHDGGTLLASPFDLSVIDIAAIPIQRERSARDVIVLSHPHAARIASGAAIRPTSLAGWRSGRTRHLASG